MKKFESNLDRLDEYFSKKSDSEKWMIILMVAGIMGYILISIFFLMQRQDIKIVL